MLVTVVLRNGNNGGPCFLYGPEHKAEDCLKTCRQQIIETKTCTFKWKFLGGLFNTLTHNSLDMYGVHFMLKSRELDSGLKVDTRRLFSER